MLFADPVFFHAWVIQVSCNIHQAQVQQHLAGSSALHVLRIQKNLQADTRRFQLFPEENEMMYEGTMYDILRMSETTHELIVLCEEDPFDSTVKKMLTGLMDFVFSPEKNSGKSTVHLSPYLPPAPSPEVLRTSDGNLRISYCPILQEGNLSQDTPPPDRS